MGRSAQISIWGWKFSESFSFSVGHVMVTEPGTENVILSQFPHAAGAPTVAYGPNTCLTFGQTYDEEARDPSIVFIASIVNPEAFDTMALNHRNRPIWDWDPTPPTQTHCARSGYDTLQAGGVAIDLEGRYVITNGETNEIIPNTLWYLLQQVPGIKVVSQIEDNLPDVERLAYEADITRYVPFSHWHQQNR